MSTYKATFISDDCQTVVPISFEGAIGLTDDAFETLRANLARDISRTIGKSGIVHGPEWVPHLPETITLPTGDPEG